MALPKAPSIPKPFKRDGIELSAGQTRTWHDTPIDRLQRGDIIRDFGALGDAEYFMTDRGQYQLKATNAVTGDVRYFTFEVGPELLMARDPQQAIPTVFAFSEG